MRTIKIADLFCGAGGTSTGAIRAVERMGARYEMLAVNHWPTAVRTHELNHPTVRHLCADLNSLDPLKVSGKLDLLCASPECTHHSNARGGKPCDDQSRASAWHVLHWLDKTSPGAFFMENVKEFVGWGPLGLSGRPIKAKAGALFKTFIHAIESMGYRVEHKLVNAADYGDPTSRTRLIIMGSRGRSVRWPEQTHAKDDGKLSKWRSAREIIDWSLPGRSIFEGRKLRPNTLKRILVGLNKFNGPFLVKLYGTSTVASLEDPLPTVTASGQHLAICDVADAEPFLLRMDHSKNPGKHAVHSLDKPFPTITTADAMAICQPFLCKYYGTGGATSLEDPLDTVTTKDRFLLVQPDGRRLDVRFRMLQPHELAAAMSFPANYHFHGTREQRVKQIGNAVPVRLAEAHCLAALQ